MKDQNSLFIFIFFISSHGKLNRKLILERLAVESLRRFRSVSKKWRSTIDSPRFQSRELKLRRQSRGHDLLFVAYYEDPPDDVAQHALGSSSSCIYRTVKFPFPNLLLCYGSCDGLSISTLKLSKSSVKLPLPMHLAQATYGLVPLPVAILEKNKLYLHGRRYLEPLMLHDLHSQSYELVSTPTTPGDCFYYFEIFLKTNSLIQVQGGFPASVEAEVMSFTRRQVFFVLSVLVLTMPFSAGVTNLRDDGQTLFCGLDDGLKMLISQVHGHKCHVYSWEPVIYRDSVWVWVSDISKLEPLELDLRMGMNA
ncbi:hypothetical protein Bca52824_079272 [Brassica carinata]|uniref:F-box domain-containing protein n=1 Tax=Brassica carinata TaxID=52824 RepID=A0A8X7PZ93_BRACI|nr:hypothetical protein Bca52824_079272 [Brassica carinata]